MVDINTFVKKFVEVLDETFGERVWFVGLQGSYGRGEAIETSDIDLVVILDKLDCDDICKYNSMLDKLVHRELICGFLSGRSEILAWEPSDLFQFYYDTKPVKGSLEAILDFIDGDALERAIKIGVCNIYHGCVHNMLYDKSEDILRGLYKSASFVLQAIYFSETGKYISCQKDLCCVLSESNRNISETYIKLKNGGTVDFDSMSQDIFNWSKRLITKG